MRAHKKRFLNLAKICNLFKNDQLATKTIYSSVTIAKNFMLFLKLKLDFKIDFLTYFFYQYLIYIKMLLNKKGIKINEILLIISSRRFLFKLIFDEVAF